MNLYDCNNESTKDMLLEGCTQSVVIGCRFDNATSGNEVWIRSDIAYTAHSTITNPADITVAAYIFSNSTCKVHFEGGDNGTYPQTSTRLGGRIAVVNNRFNGSGYSPLQWAGDDESTSFGGSVIEGNTIAGANQSKSTTPQEIVDGLGNNLGSLWASGISIFPATA